MTRALASRRKYGMRPFHIPFPRQPLASECPWAVEVHGLDRNNLSRPSEFEEELQNRRDWCVENARGLWMVQPMGPNPEQLIGRRFRFADHRDAVFFRLRFETDLR